MVPCCVREGHAWARILRQVQDCRLVKCKKQKKHVRGRKETNTFVLTDALRKLDTFLCMILVLKPVLIRLMLIKMGLCSIIPSHASIKGFVYNFTAIVYAVVSKKDLETWSASDFHMNTIGVSWASFSGLCCQWEHNKANMVFVLLGWVPSILTHARWACRMCFLPDSGVILGYQFLVVPYRCLVVIPGCMEVVRYPRGLESNPPGTAPSPSPSGSLA